MAKKGGRGKKKKLPAPPKKEIRGAGVGLPAAVKAGEAQDQPRPGESLWGKGFSWGVLSPHPAHRGAPVQVGPHRVLAGACRDLTAEDLGKADVLIPLLQDLPPFRFGCRYEILAAPLADYGGVPAEWTDFLRQQVIPLLAGGKRVLAFCMGGHGRTGTFLASLIALLEDPQQTPDPITAARERHCERAVESLVQAEAVFALRGKPLPAKYQQEFRPRIPAGFSGLSGVSSPAERERSSGSLLGGGYSSGEWSTRWGDR